MISALRADGEARLGMTESGAFAGGHLTPAAVPSALNWITVDPSYTSYLVLMALDRDLPGVIASIKAGTIAQILCSALEQLVFVNDFGYLDPSGAVDGPAGALLRKTGMSASPWLRQLLSDTRPASLWGGEEATIADLYAYRRCDYAYHFLMIARGSVPAFDPSPEHRDDARLALMRALAAE